MVDHNQNGYEEFVYVKDSPIHGKGIYTSRFINTGAKIMVIGGEVLSGEECERREDEENNVYIFWNGETYIDTNNTEKIKYINHDCDYNCDVQDRDESTLWLVAARDIKIDEELTIDYGYDEIYETCSCNNCENKDNQ
jgi:SET domain-containing protein